MFNTNSFVSHAQNEQSWKKTENNADSLNTTGSALLNLFGQIGALRTRDETEIELLFEKAYLENKRLAVIMSFYARNVRGGLGERRVARIIWKWLAKYHPEMVIPNIKFIPEFGRWDDLYTFVDTKVEQFAFFEIKNQLIEDLRNIGENKKVSLMGKWLKSINTSSEKSRALGKLTAKYFIRTEKEYRQLLSQLRKQINVVERLMCNKEFANINYERVPSVAMNNYRKAFVKRDPERFSEYMEKVKSGESKINAGTLYPYNIIEKILYNYEKDDVLEEQWKALPNYIEGENNMLVMADVSGSMSGRPMATSVGLALYFAERNKGVFNNVFMTFSSNPTFHTIKGSNLYERVRNAVGADWRQNTDIEKAFRFILNVAVNNNVPHADVPKALIIISDMEFDQATMGHRDTYHNHMKSLYAEYGYELPKLIFWNVEARQDTFHATENDNVQFISGQSTSAFKSFITGKTLSAYELMLDVLNDPMYERIVT